MIADRSDRATSVNASDGGLEGAAATAGRPTASRRAVARRVLLLVAVVAVVFGLVLPRLIDWTAVVAALEALTPFQLGLLAATTVVAYVASAGPARILVPGLSWRRAVSSDLAARAVITTVPGPTDVATRFVLYRGWAIPTDVATAGIALAGLFETFSVFALPLIATATLLADPSRAQPRALQLAAVSLVALVAASALLVGIGRSESLARRLGDSLETAAGRVWRLFRKPPPTGIVEGMLDLRARSSVMLSDRGARAFGAAVAARLAWFVVLEVALWCVGIGPDVVPPSDVLTAMAVVGIVSLIPITPGAVGVAEVAYVEILSTVAGPGLTDQLTAAVMLFRIAQWLAPVPIGWALLVALRRGHWRELLAGGDAATSAS